MIFYSDNQTPPTTPERFRTAAQQEERDQRVMGSLGWHMIPDQQPSPPLPAPVPAPLTIEQLTAQHAALPALQPVRHGRPRKNIPVPALAPAPAPLTIEQLAAQ